MSRGIRPVSILLAVWALIQPGRSPAANVAIVHGKASPYRIAVAALASVLQQHGHECTLNLLPHADQRSAREQLARRLGQAKPAIIAAVGVEATSFVLEQIETVPVVFLMVPNALDRSFIDAEHGHLDRLAGVTTDLTPEVIVDWLAHLHPSGKRIGVLDSPQTARTVEALRRAARSHQLELISIPADKHAFPEAIKALDRHRCHGVLMIPDPRVYDRVTIPHLLLWGLRNRKPVWSFSEPIVKAGALAGQYADHESIGRQAAALVQRIIQGEQPRDIGLRYPQHVRRAVNDHTAKRLGMRWNERKLDPTILRFPAKDTHK